SRLEQSRAGLIEAPSPLARLGRRLFLQRLQVGQVGEAVRAADGVEVKVDVVAPSGVEGAQQEAAELVACGTTQALAPPDGAEGVLTAVALLDEGPQLPA